MLVVKVELHSAITGEVQNLGSMVIDNVGGSRTKGNYRSRAYRKGAIHKYEAPGFAKALWSLPREEKPIREGRVENHPRLSQPVWSLVRKALQSMEY